MWGAGRVRLSEYLRDGPGGRLFWLSAGAVSTLVAVGFTIVMLTLPWHHPHAKPGAPVWWVWSLAIPIAACSAWWAAFAWAGVRAMRRHRSDAVADEA